MHKTLLGILLVLAVPAVCFAQDGVTDWQNLQKLKARNSIRIFKVNSPAIDGRFVRFSADAIVIDVDKVQMSIQRSDVQRVYRKKRRLFRGLIGAGIGAAAGFAILAKTDNEEDFYGFAVPFFPVAVGAGAATGALIPGDTVIYRVR
jgi:hypothetical protein